VSVPVPLDGGVAVLPGFVDEFGVALGDVGFVSGVVADGFGLMSGGVVVFGVAVFGVVAGVPGVLVVALGVCVVAPGVCVFAPGVVLCVPMLPDWRLMLPLCAPVAAPAPA